jgi:alanine dehydrogenase
LLGGVPGVAPGRVLVIGGGIVGYNAAVIALGLGASVTILERSVDRMRHLDEILTGRVSLVMSSTLQIEESIVEADVVIGAVLIPGAVAPKLITREMLGVMKNGAVLCDVAIDQGGCAETSHPTTHSDPVYVVDGVTHYCVANMPGAVPITSTMALTNVTLPYVEAIADHGLAEAVARDRALARGVNVLDGKITYQAVAEAHGLEFHPLDRRPSAASPVQPALRLRRADAHDEPRRRGRECDHAHDEDQQAQQSEDDIHRRPRIAACRALA